MTNSYPLKCLFQFCQSISLFIYHHFSLSWFFIPSYMTRTLNFIKCCFPLRQQLILHVWALIVSFIYKNNSHFNPKKNHMQHAFTVHVVGTFSDKQSASNIIQIKVTTRECDLYIFFCFKSIIESINII